MGSGRVPAARATRHPPSLKTLVSLAVVKELCLVRCPHGGIVGCSIPWRIQLGVVELADKGERVAAPDLGCGHPRPAGHHTPWLDHRARFDEGTSLDDAAVA